MILLDIKKLEMELRRETLPAKAVFNYFLIHLILLSLAPLNFNSSAPTNLWVDNLGVILGLIITVGFTFHLYAMCNDSGEEERFIEYYFSLGLVVLVRLFILFLLMSIPIGALFLLFFPNVMEGYGVIIDLIMVAVVGFTYYFLLIRSFNRVLEKES